MGYITRVIDDVDSSFYHLKNSCLLYIMAFVEGHEEEEHGRDIKEIMNFMGANINASVIYDLMCRLVKKLFVKSKIGQKNKDNNKEYDQYEELNQDEEIILAKLSKTGISDTEKGIMIKNHHADAFSLNNYDSVITDKMCNNYKIKSKNELESLYIENKDFSDHIILQFVLSLYELLMTLKSKNVFIEAFLDEKNFELSKIFNETEEHVESEYGETVYGDQGKVPEQLMIWFFIQSISLSVEVSLVKNKKKQLKNMYFRRQPATWFLTYETRMEFEDQVDLETSSSKRFDFVNFCEMFIVEMQENEKLFRYNKWIFNFSTNDRLKLYCYIQYFIGCLINCVCIYFYKHNSTHTTFTVSEGTWDGAKWLIIGMSVAEVMISIINIYIFIFFNYEKTRMIERIRFINNNPGVNPDKFVNWMKINVLHSVLKETKIMNYILHGIFAILGVTTIPVFHCLH